MNLTMTELNHKEAFEEFVEKAEEELGSSLIKMVLYGSVARGEQDSESDVDVFAVVDQKEDLEDLRDLAYEIGVLKYEVVINVQGRTRESFEGFEDSSYLRNISTEGIEYA